MTPWTEVGTELPGASDDDLLVVVEVGRERVRHIWWGAYYSHTNEQWETVHGVPLGEGATGLPCVVTHWMKLPELPS